jgi:hypothetical protein
MNGPNHDDQWSVCKLFKEFIMQRKEDILEAFICIIHDSLANQPTRQLHQNQDGLGLTLPEFNNFLSLSAFSSLHLPPYLSVGLRIYRCENVAG